ncbi:hypothetical protein CBR_g10977 [Chara braunii]|uniref:Uncharacterized protein n=1 Tax=Chara braunii TaxID=69332 RepID=A0A388KPS9_CHABU|nr:hypothetical protein CBR_g10977 [Chara braunii]|eukprot:GBG72042.1 hypothetical protein CBR_g10977 [Chara braunii]
MGVMMCEPMQAELRANIFEVIEENDQDSGGGDNGVVSEAMTGCNQQARALHSSTLGKLLADLVCEYLEWCELDHTLKVYIPECNLQSKYPKRVELEEELGIPSMVESGHFSTRPLLAIILESYCKMVALHSGVIRNGHGGHRVVIPNPKAWSGLRAHDGAENGGQDHGRNIESAGHSGKKMGTEDKPSRTQQESRQDAVMVQRTHSNGAVPSSAGSDVVADHAPDQERPAVDAGKQVDSRQQRSEVHAADAPASSAEDQRSTTRSSLLGPLPPIRPGRRSMGVTPLPSSTKSSDASAGGPNTRGSGAESRGEATREMASASHPAGVAGHGAAAERGNEKDKGSSGSTGADDHSRGFTVTRTSSGKVDTAGSGQPIIDKDEMERRSSIRQLATEAAFLDAKASNTSCKDVEEILRGGGGGRTRGRRRFEEGEEWVVQGGGGGRARERSRSHEEDERLQEVVQTLEGRCKEVARVGLGGQKRTHEEEEVVQGGVGGGRKREGMKGKLDRGIAKCFVHEMEKGGNMKGGHEMLCTVEGGEGERSRGVSSCLQDALHGGRDKEVAGGTPRRKECDGGGWRGSVERKCGGRIGVWRGSEGGGHCGGRVSSKGIGRRRSMEGDLKMLLHRRGEMERLKKKSWKKISRWMGRLPNMLGQVIIKSNDEEDENPFFMTDVLGKKEPEDMTVDS